MHTHLGKGQKGYEGKGRGFGTNSWGKRGQEGKRKGDPASRCVQKDELMDNLRRKGVGMAIKKRSTRSTAPWTNKHKVISWEIWSAS